LSIRPDTRVRRISATRCIAAAAAATRRASVRQGVTPSNPSGYSSAMKAVVISPETKRGWSITALRNGRLWPIPSTSKLSSATRIASSASPGPAPQVQSLAIIGS
jgi:hypothetical protein